MKILISMLLGFVMAISGSAMAGDVTRENYTLDICTPGTVDGSQVFVSSYLDGKCNGNRKVVLYIADYTLQVLCSVQGLSCVPLAEMSDEQKWFYKELEKRRAPIAAPKVCVQRHGTLWRYEMITSKEALCTPALNGARSYDTISKQGCVYLGTKMIGCVKINDEDFKSLANQ